MHTAEPLAPEPTSLRLKFLLESLRGTEAPGIDQILGELIQAGDKTLDSGPQIY